MWQLALGQIQSPALYASTFLPESLALFARFTTPPDDARKVLINNFISALIAGGVWAKLDALYVLAAADNQAARQNWVQNLYNATAVSSPTFVADRYYAGDGTTSYLSTGFNPTTASSPKFTQNSAHLGHWSLSSLANAGSTSFDVGQTQARISRLTSGQAEVRPNVSVVTTNISGSYPGSTIWSRSGAAAYAAYAQGVNAGSGTTASTAPQNSVFRICSVVAAFGVNQEAIMHIGGDLSAGEVSTFYAAQLAYLQGVGAV